MEMILLGGYFVIGTDTRYKFPKFFPYINTIRFFFPQETVTVEYSVCCMSLPIM